MKKKVLQHCHQQTEVQELNLARSLMISSGNESFGPVSDRKKRRDSEIREEIRQLREFNAELVSRHQSKPIKSARILF